MIVNQIAKAAGVEPHVVRYYTRIGLLQPRRDPENGYQHFSPNDMQRLQCIRQLQSIGLTLNEIRTLLATEDYGTPQWNEEVRRLLLAHMAENKQRLRELSALQDRMERAYQCDHVLIRHDSVPSLPGRKHVASNALDLSAAHRFYSYDRRPREPGNGPGPNGKLPMDRHKRARRGAGGFQ